MKIMETLILNLSRSRIPNMNQGPESLNSLPKVYWLQLIFFSQLFWLLWLSKSIKSLKFIWHFIWLHLGNSIYYIDFFSRFFPETYPWLCFLNYGGNFVFVVLFFTKKIEVIKDFQFLSLKSNLVRKDLAAHTGYTDIGQL